MAYNWILPSFLYMDYIAYPGVKLCPAKAIESIIYSIFLYHGILIILIYNNPYLHIFSSMGAL